STERPSEADQTQPLQGREEGRQRLRGATTVDHSEQPKPQSESALSRAVDRTRVLYERHGWTFLPLGEAGKGSPSLSNLQGEQQPYSGGTNKPELHSPKELPLPFEPNLPSEERR